MNEPIVLECRLKPPEASGLNSRGLFPLVLADDWCGSFHITEAARAEWLNRVKTAGARFATRCYQCQYAAPARSADPGPCRHDLEAAEVAEREGENVQRRLT